MQGRVLLSTVSTGLSPTDLHTDNQCVDNQCVNNQRADHLRADHLYTNYLHGHCEMLRNQQLNATLQTPERRMPEHMNLRAR
jgi:hypothetical protein